MIRFILSSSVEGRMQVVTSYSNSYFVVWSVCYFLMSVLGVSDKRHVLDLISGFDIMSMRC